MRNGALKIFFIFCLFFSINYIQAEPVEGNSVVLKVLDKVTARISDLEISVGESAKFGSLEINIFLCKKRPPEEVPENFVLMRILDEISPNNFEKVFQGWMISSSPAVAPFEHPTYDVWVKFCNIDNVSK